MSIVPEKDKKFNQGIALLMEAFDLYAPKEAREGQDTSGTMAAFMIDLETELYNELSERVREDVRDMLLAVLSHTCRVAITKRDYNKAIPPEKRYGYDQSEFLLADADKAVEQAEKFLTQLMRAYDKDTGLHVRYDGQDELASAIETYKRLKECA